MYTKQHIISLKGSDNMATAPTQIRIDSDVKKQANDLFSHLGLDMSWKKPNAFLKTQTLKGTRPWMN